MNGSEKTDARLAGIFQEGLSAWQSAAETAGVVERSYSIAGYPIRLRFAGPALVEPITRALAHHEPCATAPQLTVYLGDSLSTGTDLPARLGLATGDPNGAGWIHRGEPIRARFQPDYHSLHMLDTSRNVALFWTGDARRIRFWEKSAPLLLIFHWWMALRDRQLVHAAALGTETGGVLLVGKGGAGKSTTALACLQSDLSYAGDDYHLIALDPVPFAFSLYNSAKVDAARLRDFENLRASVANPDDLPEEKALVFLKECWPEKLSPGFPIRAVLVPRLAQRRETSIRPASPAAALAALAPSTIFQLRERDADSLAVMAELLRQAPSYTLELGTDLSQIAPVILELLARLAAAPKPRPLASVIIPVYNGELFLAAALESVFVQDYGPIEVIIVDDGSTDRTAEIARSFDGARYLFQENQGQAAARNAGFEKARGEFIAFLDADDLMLPNKISAQVDYLLAHPEAGCVLSGREIFLEPGAEAPARLKNDRLSETGGAPPSLSPSSDELAHLRAGGMSSVVARRRLLERIGGLDPSFRHVDDLDWLLRARESGLDVGVLPQILWRRRIHGANVSRRRDRVEKEWLHFLKKKIARHRRAAMQTPAAAGTNPLVSVVVPVYNGERFLAEAIESSLAQDYRPIEVIVVDDGSTDRTAEIARSFDGIRYVRQENQGPSAARNAGIRESRGEFVAFLDADDLMLPNKVGVQMKYLADHPEYDCVLCRQKILLEPGTPMPAWFRPDALFGDPGGIPPGSALVRRAAIVRAGCFDPNYRLAEIMEWLGRLREGGIKIAVVPEVLMLRRIHEANLTHQNRKLREKLLQGLKGKIDRMRASKSARRGDS